jgi:hypothetical protein
MRKFCVILRIVTAIPFIRRTDPVAIRPAI